MIRGRSEAENREHEALREAVLELLSQGVRLVTTNLVIAETHQLLLVRTDRNKAREFLSVLPLPGLVIVASDPETEHRAVDQWIDRFDDHDISLADDVSFVVMQDRGLRRALTLDHHFAAAGFELVPLG